MSEKDSTRSQIVAAARKRFAHFGYGKTTMAELAADCGMSPGNLYRFFPGKLDIAEAIASADYQSHLARLGQKAARPGLSARQKLCDVLREELRRTHAKLEKGPRAAELARVIAAERPQFAAWMEACQRALMVRLLEEAEAQGEFCVADKEFAAQMIQSATLKFRYPQLWSGVSLARLEHELDGLVALLLAGLALPRQPSQDVA